LNNFKENMEITESGHHWAKIHSSPSIECSYYFLSNIKSVPDPGGNSEP